MTNTIIELLIKVIGSAKPISIEEIEAFERRSGIKFPTDLKEALPAIHAGMGEVGRNGYLDLFSIHQIEEINEDYEYVMEQIPEYYLFAKDAADTGYAFHKKNQTYHAFGLMSNFEFDSLDSYGNSFDEFIDTLDHEYE